MFKKQSDPFSVKMETEIKQLKCEIETLKLENAELREINNKLKSFISTRPQGAAAADSRPSTDSELQQQLNRTSQQLSETRQQLLNVQERLTVSEQVTAATQRRELQQEGFYENLPSDSDYQELRFAPTEEHVYARLQITTHTGCIVSFSIAQIVGRNSIVHFPIVNSDLFF